MEVTASGKFPRIWFCSGVIHEEQGSDSNEMRYPSKHRYSSSITVRSESLIDCVLFPLSWNVSTKYVCAFVGAENVPVRIRFPISGIDISSIVKRVLTTGPSASTALTLTKKCSGITVLESISSPGSAAVIDTVTVTWSSANAICGVNKLDVPPSAVPAIRITSSLTSMFLYSKGLRITERSCSFNRLLLNIAVWFFLHHHVLGRTRPALGCHGAYNRNSAVASCIDLVGDGRRFAVDVMSDSCVHATAHKHDQILYRTRHPLIHDLVDCLSRFQGCCKHKPS